MSSTEEPSLEEIHADLFAEPDEDEEATYYPPQEGDVEF